LHRATDKPEGGVDRWTPRRREARHIADSAWSTKRYLNIELLKDQQMKGVHHRVSQSRVPLSQTESAKDSGLYQPHCVAERLKAGGSNNVRSDTPKRRRGRPAGP